MTLPTKSDGDLFNASEYNEIKNRLQDGTILNDPFSLAVERKTLATLPTAGTRGRMVYVTDDARGLHVDQGTRYAKLGGRVFYVDDFEESTVTLPAPTVAPVDLTVFEVGGRGSFTAGDTFDFALTYVGHTGETVIGPIATQVGQTGMALVVNVEPPSGVTAVACRLYIRKNAGTWYPAKFSADAAEAEFGFCDEDLDVRYTESGSAPPGVGNALDLDGNAIAAPTVAPILTVVNTIPTGTYYIAYSWVAADGTETATSPTLTATVATATGSLRCFMNQIPPSGAVFRNIYMGTVSNQLKRQKTNVPLCHSTLELFSYNSAGASPAPGAAQTTLSRFQVALDAMGNGDTLYLSPSSTPITSTHPILVAGKYNRNIIGLGTTDDNVTDTTQNPLLGKSVVKHTGTQNGVEQMVYADQGTRIENIDFDDVNSKARIGLAIFDPTGGWSFHGYFVRCGWNARYNTGTDPLKAALYADRLCSNTSTHVLSEMFFQDCTFNSNRYGVKIGGPQGVNIRFDHCTIGGGNGGGTHARGANVHVTDAVLTLEHCFASGQTTAHYVYYLRSVANKWNSGGSSIVYARYFYIEANGPRCMMFHSKTNSNGAVVHVERHQYKNQSAVSMYELWAASPMTYVANLNDGAHAFRIKNPAVAVVYTGRGPNTFKADALDHTRFAYDVYGGRIRLFNKDNAAVQVATKDAGGMYFIGRLTGAADPTTAEFASGEYGLYKNTTSGNVFWCHNDGGVLKKVQLS